MSRRQRAVLRLFATSSRALDVFVRVVRGAFAGVWLGLLGPADLRALGDQYYLGGGHDGEDVYVDEAHNRRGLWDWERDAITRFFPASGRIVVTGVGGGREVFPLLDMGYDVTGYECNAQLVEFGNRLLAADGQPRRLFRSPPDSWPEGAGVCDAVIVGWGSYMLTPSRRDRVAFLRAARGAVPAGAPILLSFFTREGSSSQLRVLAAVGNVIRRIRRAEPLLLGDALGGHYVHVFTREEIRAELRDGGFEMVHYGRVDYGHAVGVASGGRPGGSHADQGS